MAGLNTAGERHRCCGHRAVRAFLKTAGPARLAITDRGLTFATNGDRGVLISFRTPVRSLYSLGVLRHPELTVTVAEVDRLAELLGTGGKRVTADS